MSSPKKQLIHPYTYFLIEDGFSAIYDQWKERDILSGVRFLLGLTVYLTQEDRGKLKETINKLWGMLEGKIPRTERTFYDVLGEVTAFIHKEGYLMTSKFEVPTRETGLKQIAERLGGREEE
jgi:hypothetical protein